MKSPKRPRFLLAAAILLVVIIAAGVWLAVCFFGAFGPADKDIRLVLLISIDTCRADYLSCYGYERETTPNIDALAGEGVLFEDVLAPTPLTLPSHSSMLTGTIPPYHKIHDNPGYRLAHSYTTLAEILKDNGFATGAVVSSLVLHSQTGLDQGFDYYNDDYEESEDGLYSGRRAEDVSRLASSWLQEHESDDKMFLFLHYYDPHAPYDPPEPFASAFPGNAYAGEIAYVDKCIGEIIRKLKELNLYDSTLFIITSDHGEMLGEHGEDTHGYFIYEGVIKVPLIVKVPGGARGETVDDDLVGTVDIVPTICSLLGIAPPAEVQGEDLSTYITEDSGGGKDRYYYCESLWPTKYGGNSLLGVVTSRWKYILTTKPELYDLEEDPHETANLVGEQPQRAHLLREHLELILDEGSYKGKSSSTLPPDAERTKRLESLGYVTGINARETPQFYENKPDPKDLIDLYLQATKVLNLTIAKRYEEARAICEQLLKEHPQSAYFHYRLGKLSFEAGNLETAIVHLSKSISLTADDSVPGFIYASYYMLTASYIRSNRFGEAIEHLNEALQVAPSDPGLHHGLGYCLAKLDRLDEAIIHYKKALKLKPDDDLALKIHTDMARLLIGQKKPDEAIEHLSRALKLKPNQPVILKGLGTLLARRGRLDEAINQWNKSLHLKPGQAEVHNMLGRALARQGKLDLAVQQWKKSLVLKPNQPETHNLLAKAFHMRGEIQQAVLHWNEVVRLKPDVVEVLNNLAWLKAVSAKEKFHHPRDAIRLARRACELTENKRADILDTLAVAYASAGRFGEAVSTAEAALALARDAGNDKSVDEIQGHLSLFKRGQPYHETE